MKNISQEEWIERSKKTHADKYDYSLVQYVNMKTKVKIICPVHGVFEQNSSDHMRKSGCLKCKYENHFKHVRKTKEDFINESYKIHGKKYDYSKVEYINNHTKVCIICKKHGDFWQIPNKHISSKHGCLLCGKEKDLKRLEKINSKRCLNNVLFFVEKSNEVHNNKYQYLSSYVSSNIKIKIKCNKCEKVFEQLPSSHLNGQGCPICKKSKGENEIEKYLIDNNIKYISQYKFKDCLGLKRMLPFDFYLPKLNLCVEFQGRQHYEPVQFFGSSLIKAEKTFIKTQINDKIKKKFCEENNINFLEISCKDIIINKLEETICHLKIFYQNKISKRKKIK